MLLGLTLMLDVSWFVGLFYFDIGLMRCCGLGYLFWLFWLACLCIACLSLHGLVCLRVACGGVGVL